MLVCVRACVTYKKMRVACWFKKCLGNAVLLVLTAAPAAAAVNSELLAITAASSTAGGVFRRCYHEPVVLLHQAV